MSTSSFFFTFLATFVAPTYQVFLNQQHLISKASTIRMRTFRIWRMLLVAMTVLVLVVLAKPFPKQSEEDGEGEMDSVDDAGPVLVDVPSSSSSSFADQRAGTQAAAAPALDAELVAPSLTSPPEPNPSKAAPAAEEAIQLPSVMYIPPSNNILDPNATDPFFPQGSESCQKCKYFYPKLKECNRVANSTLATIPRYASGDDISSSSTATAATTTPPTSNITTILPFLQCICPEQGLAATKVCLTCFRVSNQRNFLNELVLQNVTNALSAFAEVCEDTGNGTFVPPAGTKGQSASAGDSTHGGSGIRVLSVALYLVLLQTI